MFELGNSLREARLRRRLDLVDAEQDTKIRSKYLAALENETFDVLPGSVFARGFLRTYSRYLGLDSQLYVDEFNARFGAFEDEQPEPAVASPMALDRARKRGIGFRAVAIACLLVFGVIAYVGLRHDSTQQHRKDATLDRTNSSIVPGGRDPSGKVRTPAAPATPLTGAAAAAPAMARVSVVGATGASWLEVRRGSATGAVLFQGQLAQGATKVFRAPKLVVRMGYPGALELRMRGQQPVRPTGSTATTYVVTPAGITHG